MDSLNIKRRRFLLGGISCLVAATIPKVALALPLSVGKPRTLIMTSINTGEHLDVCYFNGTAYVQEALNSLNHLCRDHRRDLATDMDKAVFDQLVTISDMVKAKHPITLVSGYRSPVTNERLRINGGGQAKKSYHMTGQAVDFYIEGVPLSSIRDAAKSLKIGGVGYYPNSGFIHVDTGPVRVW